MAPAPRRLALAALALVFAAGCSSRTVQPQQYYDKLKPISAAPQTSSTPTLIVQINNVRDAGKNRKSAATLFINNQEITPSNAQDSNARDYTYELGLAGGIYKIEARYRTPSFWKDKEFQITTHDGKVRIYPDYVTRLAITLDKKADGSLQREKNFFSEIPQSLSARTAPKISEPAAAQPVNANPPTVAKPAASFIEVTSPAPPATSNREQLPQAQPPSSGRIALQINTSPSNAEIIVNDKYLGNSPLVTYVERGQNHVVQISKAGYATRIKVIDQRELEGQKPYLLIEKLEEQK